MGAIFSYFFPPAQETDPPPLPPATPAVAPPAPAAPAPAPPASVVDQIIIENEKSVTKEEAPPACVVMIFSLIMGIFFDLLQAISIMQ